MSDEYKPSQKAIDILNNIDHLIVEIIEKHQNKTYNPAYEFAWEINMVMTIDETLQKGEKYEDNK